MLNSLLHARSPAGLVVTEGVSHSVLVEQPVPVHVDVVHVPPLDRQHFVVHPLKHQLQSEINITKLRQNIVRPINA